MPKQKNVMDMTDNEFLDDNLFFLTMALSRQLSGEADEAFTAVGLSSSHTLLLQLIQKNPGVQPGQLAKDLHLKPSTITRLVQKLERRELVEKESEGRSISIACTSKGNELAQEVLEKWNSLMAKKQEQLGERYVEVLSEMISNALAELEE